MTDKHKQHDAECESAAMAVLAERKTARRRKPKVCDDCGIYPSDPPSRFCPTCEAYREHTAT